MPRVTRSLQPLLWRDGHLPMTGNLDMGSSLGDLHHIINCCNITPFQHNVGSIGEITPAKYFSRAAIVNIYCSDNFIAMGTPTIFKSANTSAHGFLFQSWDTAYRDCLRVMNGVVDLLSDTQITDDKFLEFLNTSDGQRIRIRFTDGYPFDCYIHDLDGVELENIAYYDLAVKEWSFFDNVYVDKNITTWEPILYTPMKHICGPVTLAAGVTDKYVQLMPAGTFGQDMHVDKVVVSVDVAPSAGKTVTVTVSDGTNTMTVTIADDATSGFTTTNNFDLDVSAESLTLNYSQTAGGLSRVATIACVHHYITNV